MTTDVSSRITVEATIENLFDSYSVRRGLLRRHEIRRITVEAVVAPEVVRLALPYRAIRELGLRPVADTMPVNCGEGLAVAYTPIRLCVQERDCHVEVVRSDDDFVRIGSAALTLMDWIVDPKEQRLIGNPAHGGEQTIEPY